MMENNTKVWSKKKVYIFLQILLSAGFAIISFAHTFMMQFLLDECFDEYKMQMPLTIDDLTGEIAFWGFFFAFLLAATILAKNWFCALWSIGMSAAVLSINVPNITTVLWVKYSIDSWISILYMADALCNLLVIIYSLSYILWYIRNWRKKGNFK